MILPTFGGFRYKILLLQQVSRFPGLSRAPFAEDWWRFLRA